MERKKLPTKKTDPISQTASEVARRTEAPADEDTPIDYISTGSTLLNLALTDHMDKGYPIGRMTHMAGDSGAGKTLAYLTMLAELCQNPKYDHYELYLDAAEEGMDMDVSKMFGKRLASRLRQPHHDKDGDFSSTTVWDFFRGVAKRVKAGKPFIYGLDSFDAICTEEDVALLDVLASDKKVPGSYDMGKQKLNSKMLGTMISDFKKMDSVLFIISQLRDNIGAIMPGSPKSKISGGRALLFYAHQQIWLKRIKKIKDNKYERELGNIVRASVAKNRSTGKKRDADFAIYTTYGIDDIGSCVDFLVETGVWEKDGKTTIVAPELNTNGSRNALIDLCDDSPEAMRVLRHTTAAAWKNIEDAIALKRRGKYE